MIKDIIISFIIGIGKILPGVSGSMLAITFGVYDKIINSIINPIKNIKYILIFTPSFLLALVLGSTLISIIFENNYQYTMLFFIGLISGIIPKVIKKSFRKENIVLFIIILIIPILLTTNTKSISNIELSYGYILILGLIEAITSIIPGVSGSAILLIIGQYNNVMFFFRNLLNINMIKQTIYFGIPYSLGMIIGFYFISKLIKKLINCYEDKFYTIVSALSISSIILMFRQTFNVQSDSFSLIIGIVVLAIGFAISTKFDK